MSIPNTAIGRLSPAACADYGTLYEALNALYLNGAEQFTYHVTSHTAPAPIKLERMARPVGSDIFWYMVAGQPIVTVSRNNHITVANPSVIWGATDEDKYPLVRIDDVARAVGFLGACAFATATKVGFRCERRERDGLWTLVVERGRETPAQMVYPFTRDTNRPSTIAIDLTHGEHPRNDFALTAD